MNDPDYGTISDIDPDGGGDYTTLQAWYEDTYDEAAVQHARCHHSDSTDLGELDTSTQNWSYTPTAEEPVCIYAADGDEADGSQDDDLQGAAILAEAAGAACLAVEWEAVKVHGLRLTPSGQYGLGVNFDGCESVLIERCTVVIDAAAGGGILVAQEEAGETTAATVRNNLVLNTNSSQPTAGIVALANSGSSTVNATLHGNSVANCGADVQGGVVGYAFVGDTVNVAARNNVAVDDGVPFGDCFAEKGAGAVGWSGSSHNVSSDATAKGTDALINKAIGDVGGRRRR